MSGLEVAAAIAGIISAFNGSVTLYRSWQEKKKKRRKANENRELEISLTRGGTTVNQKYTLHFSRLGQQFAVGDDQARAELSEYVIKLQHIIITILTDTNTSSIVLPSLPALLSTSEDTRTGVVNTLGEQYQRMLQSRPLISYPNLSSQLQTLSPTPQIQPISTDLRPCPGSIYYQKDEDVFKCSNCLFYDTHWALNHIYTIESKDGIKLGVPQVTMMHWHQFCESKNSPKGVYVCKLCPPSANDWLPGNIFGIHYHFKAHHTREEIERVVGKHNVLPCTCVQCWDGPDGRLDGEICKHDDTCRAKARGMELWEEYGFKGKNNIVWRRRSKEPEDSS